MRGGKPITGVEDTLVGLDSTPSAPPTATPTSPATVSSVPPATPQVLGERYQILGLIGAGGMGRVYRVHDRVLDEPVALKVLRSELIDAPGAAERFRQEVKLARRITHRNIARMFDIGESGGQAFLTMELIDGCPLSHVIAEHKSGVPPADLMSFARQITAGLVAAHAVSIVHRDLKPDNVLIARDGRVVITDFGIARALWAPGGGTAATLGTGIGTPAYMAPEQVDQSAPADARADIYAFGAMLYELATGARAWPGDSPLAVAAARLMQPPPDPRARRPLPDALAQLVLRCMSRDPDQRFASAAELAGALDHVETALSAWHPLPAPTLPPAAPKHLRPLPAALPTPTAARTIAVLPIENTGSPDDEYLADALTEDLIDRLSMTRGLKVRTRGAVMGMKGDQRDPRELGRELGVDVVASGTLRRGSSGLRVTLRLTGVADGFQLWAHRFERPADSTLEIDAAAAAEIARALTLRSEPGRREVPSDPVALDLYLRGRHEYNSFRRDKMERACELYRQALLRSPEDPTILTAHALATARLWFLLGTAEGHRYADEARSTARRARKLAPQRAEPLVASACVALHDGDAATAVRELCHALHLDANLVMAQEFLGRILIEVGRPEDGIRHLKTALALDPFVPVVRWELARIAELMGDGKTADALFEQPVTSEAEETGRVLTLARVALWRRNWKMCLSALEGASIDSPPVVFARSLGELLRNNVTLEVEPARAFIQRVDFIAATLIANPRQRALMHQLRAEVAGYHDDAPSAIDALEKADAANLMDICWLDMNPLLGALRAHPDYDRLRAPIAARAALAAAAYDLATGLV